MKLERLDPYDDKAIAEAVRLYTAVHAADEPGRFPVPTTWELTAGLRHVPPDGPSRRHLLRSDGGEVIGDLLTRLPERDNTHQAVAIAAVHPEHRRRGHGTRLVDEGVRLAQEAGRRTVIAFSDDAPAPRAFAERLGFTVALTEVLRRQDLAELDRDELARLRAYAYEKAGDYTLLRLTGPVPDDLLDDVAVMANAIHDAPREDLDEEDDLIDADYFRMYERIQAARGRRRYHVIARHRGSGQLAGHTILDVDGYRPQWGHQQDTSVVHDHRGHRLGLLVKADMLTWLSQVEPDLRYVTTGNAGSNQHMIAINEQLGYRVLSRSLVWQRPL